MALLLPFKSTITQSEICGNKGKQMLANFVYCSDMTYFAIICSTKTVSSKFGGIRGINQLRYK